MSVVLTRECAVRSTLESLETFAAEKMCRKCVVCPFAVSEMARTLGGLIAGQGVSGDTDRVQAMAAGLQETAMCKLGQDIAVQVQEVLGDSGDRFLSHEEGRCPDGVCSGLLSYTISPAKCTLCGACKDVCPADAVVGERPPWYMADCAPFRIRKDKCTRCGLCVPVCEPQAIETH
ncbi:MAG: 4Fe-4S binding protein [Coriobacteriia bacterium]|nr:4Fe-4S binding protein [Coriobacteriia bacterium]